MPLSRWPCAITSSTGGRCRPERARRPVRTERDRRRSYRRGTRSRKVGQRHRAGVDAADRSYRHHGLGHHLQRTGRHGSLVAGHRDRRIPGAAGGAHLLPAFEKKILDAASTTGPTDDDPSGKVRPGLDHQGAVRPDVQGPSGPAVQVGPSERSSSSWTSMGKDRVGSIGEDRMKPKN